MVKNKETLPEFEVRIKDFIKDERHEENGKTQSKLILMDEKLDKLSDKFDDFKDYIVSELKQERERSDAKYATKQEHQENSDKIDEIRKSQVNVLVSIAAVLGTFVIALI